MMKEFKLHRNELELAHYRLMQKSQLPPPYDALKQSETNGSKLIEMHNNSPTRNPLGSLTVQ